MITYNNKWILTFVDSKAKVALPPLIVDKVYKRVNVCAAYPTPHYDCALDHRQLLQQKFSFSYTEQAEEQLVWIRQTLEYPKH